MADTLKQTLMQDLKQALKGGDKLKCLVIRSTIAAITNAEKSKMKELDDADTLGIIAKQVKQHKDLDGQVGEGEIVDAADVASNLKKGASYMTIHNGLSETWKRGEMIRGFMIDGEYHIRIDKNKVKHDHLGMLNEF